MVLGAEDHSSREAQHRAKVTAVCQVQKSRGNEQRHRGGAAGLAAWPERAQACVCDQEGTAKRPAQALGFVRSPAQSLKHVAWQVALSEEGCWRPALAVQGSKTKQTEKKKQNSPGVPRVTRAMRNARPPCASPEMRSRRSAGPKMLLHPRETAGRIASPPGGTQPGAEPCAPTPAPPLLYFFLAS